MIGTKDKLPQFILSLKKRPVIDLNDPRQFRRFLFFAASGLVVMLFMVVATYQSVEFMDSSEFCGEVCHAAMKPEFEAYKSSPHARVNCVNCHIGPGADFLVKAKIDGMRQVVALAMNSFSRPIPSPVHNLRPSRETCEKCHWPEKFYEDRIRMFQKYDSDEKNTETRTTLVFRVGGVLGKSGKGVHWHIKNKVWFLPADEKRQEIAWTGVETEDGKLVEYINPELASQVTEEHLKKEKRVMDCIDCHNRATHVFQSPEKAIDKAMAAGLIDKDLPFIKKRALEAIESSKSEAEAFDKIVNIDEFYRTLYPSIYGTKREHIKEAITELKEIYKSTVFPANNVDAKTHPNNLGHMESPGCFRCHGKLAEIKRVEGKTEITKTTVRSTCNLCHFSLPTDIIGGY